MYHRTLGSVEIGRELKYAHNVFAAQVHLLLCGFHDVKRFLKSSLYDYKKFSKKNRFLKN